MREIIQNNIAYFVLLKRSGQDIAIGGAVDKTLAPIDIHVKIGN